MAVVGEAWGSSEHDSGRPFVGEAGFEFTKILADAGLDRNQLFITNLTPAQPPSNDLYHFFTLSKGHKRGDGVRGLHPTDDILADRARLLYELNEVNPDLIIAAGNYALWALSPHTGYRIGKDRRGKSCGIRVPTGIMDWRGSMIETHDLERPTKLLPIIHPAAIIRQWPLRAVTVQDLRVRVRQALANDWTPRVPPILLAPPTFDQAVGRLRHILAKADAAPIRVAADVETKRINGYSFVSCISLCDDPNFSMSIPFVYPQTYKPYWTTDQEAELWYLIGLALNHPNVLTEGQNFTYDLQHLAAECGVFKQHDWDTMDAQHLLFPGTPKDLGYLSSLYCTYHRFWKDDNKEWDEKGDLITHLRYNAEDSLRTYEIATTQREIIATTGRQADWRYMRGTTGMALEMMRNGLLIDQQIRAEMRTDCARAAMRLEMWLESVAPQDLVNPDPKAKANWWRSPKQTIELFEGMGFKWPVSRKTGSKSSDKEALAELKKRYPGGVELFDRLLVLRSLAIYVKNFLTSALEPDGSMRCTIGHGPYTFRFRSSKNAFGRGTNMQNIPVNIKKHGSELDDDDIPDDVDDETEELLGAA